MLVNTAGDAFHTATAGEATDGHLGDALDGVGENRVHPTLKTFSANNHEEASCTSGGYM